jgi:hypothetical protein
MGWERTGGNRKKITRARKRIGIQTPNLNLKRLSTLRNGKGEVRAQWEILEPEPQKQQELLEARFAGFTDNLPRIAPTPAPKALPSDLLNFYSLWDYHLGMLSWGEETGANWDLDIAEEMAYGWLNNAIQRAPKAETGLFVAGGDTGHWDGMAAVTPEHGNLLDADTRFQELGRVEVRVARRVITDLLDTHARVHIKWLSGNHDPATAAIMREWLSAHYENETRVEIDTTPGLYSAYQHGLTGLFFHHGHKRGTKKAKRVDTTVARQFRQIFGSTEFCVCHVGHLHSHEILETDLMHIEQHGTLAAPDAYAHGGGWRSRRAAQVITYSAKTGEAGRIMVTPEMLELAA